MPMNLDAIGAVGEPQERSWAPDDTLLYALAVGAGYPDPLQELQFTTENTADQPQHVLPTFGVIKGAPGGSGLMSMGQFNPAMLVHADQGIVVHTPLKPAGSISATTRLVDIQDKRSGALVLTETECVDSDSGELAFTTSAGLFIRGEGGFSSGDDGGSSNKVNENPGIPDRNPDHRVTCSTLPNQALFYRLCGDRNPLHSDPSFAAMGGFDRPILHGLCTYGFTGRALLHGLCDGDPARFSSMYGRFSKPVMPGDTLTIHIWLDAEGGAASFRTTDSDDAIVVDRGRCTFTE